MKKTKKILSLLLTVVMIICMLTAGSPAILAETTDNTVRTVTYDGLTYTIRNETAILSSCDTSVSGDVIIPDYIEGCPVKRIAMEAIYQCNNITSLTLPNTLTDITEAMVWGCDNLKRLVINSDIEDPYFYYAAGMFLCENLEVLEFGDNVTFVDNCTTKFLHSASCIKLGKNIQSIRSFAFNNFYNIETIDIPESVRNIEAGAFNGCSSLREIAIPYGVAAIEESTFNGCSSLQEITIPDSVTTIGEDAFSGCSSLETVELPNGITSIGQNTFADCSSLKSINIPESVEHIRAGAFRNTKLEKIVIDNRLCTLDYDEELLPEDTVIYGHKNSPASMYAQIFNRTFVALDDGECTHDFGDWTVAQDADCTQRGFAYRVCPLCSEVETKILPPTGHSDADGDDICDECGADATVTEKEAADEQTGVSVIYPDGAFDGEAEIQVTPVSEGDAYRLISHKEGNYKVTMFDISVTVNGESVQPNGKVLVKIPLPKGYNPNKCVVYYVAADGTMEELETYHVKDGYVWFETDHFSYYAVTQEDDDSKDTDNWMNSSLNFVQTIIDFINRIADLFRSIFNIA